MKRFRSIKRNRTVSAEMQVNETIYITTECLIFCEKIVFKKPYQLTTTESILAVPACVQ